MTYSATTWQTGDLITAALLNNTESQYNTYSTDWGYIKLNTLSAATTDTVIAFDQSTYSIGVSGAYKKWLAIRLPPHVQSTKCLLIFRLICPLALTTCRITNVGRLLTPEWMNWKGRANVS